MSVFSALWRLLKKLFTKILNAIGGILKKYWAILLVCAVIWFAPQIASWLLANGAPAWITTGFSTIATTLTPVLVDAVTWVASGATGVLSQAYAAYVDAGIGWQLAIAAGVAAAAAPEEFAAVVDEAGQVIGDVVETVVGVAADAVGSVLSSPLGLAAGAAGLFLLLNGGSKDMKEGQNGQAA